MVAASGLQVSPVSLSLQASQNADGLWLSNSGDGIVHAQVRVYHWTQSGGEEQLTPSRGLLVSPPMLQIKPGEKQLIRVIRVGAPPNGANAVEDAYRLAIDELPVDRQGKPGLQFVLHYSVPIFVEPLAAKTLQPDLQWSMQQKDGHVFLRIANNGSGHAQLAQLSFADKSGHRVEVSGGLLGYILPGAVMDFALTEPTTSFADSVTFEAMINGAKVTQDVLPVERAH
ncbi:MAG: fimbria/pilus periplasmic chaperone [Dokdonella sp.]